MNSVIQFVSLFIPHVQYEYRYQDIADIFNGINIGKVSSIDFVEKKSKRYDTLYNAVYIHFEYWLDNHDSREFQEQVLNPKKQAKVYYDNELYWIVLPNVAKKHVPGDRKQKIDLGAPSISCAPMPDVTPDRIALCLQYIDELCNAPMKQQKPAVNIVEDDLEDGEIRPLNLYQQFEEEEQVRYELGLRCQKRDDYEQEEINAWLTIQDYEDEVEHQEDIIRMEELEDMIEEEDGYFINIDGRYVVQMENEIIALMQQIHQLNTNFQNYYTNLCTYY